ncbi:hypothetical protein ACHAW6_007778 [Cyclotella cf. meneghiniana]
MSSWGNLLITTGGALKPPKCFYYLLSNSWDNRGQWAFMHTTDLRPTPDGTSSPIAHLLVDTPRVTLGAATYPLGIPSA